METGLFGLSLIEYLRECFEVSICNFSSPSVPNYRFNFKIYNQVQFGSGNRLERLRCVFLINSQYIYLIKQEVDLPIMLLK